MNATIQKPTIGRIVHYQQPCASTNIHYQQPCASTNIAGSDSLDHLPPPYITRMALVTGVRTVNGVDYPVLRVLCDYTLDDFTIDCSPGGYMNEGVSEAQVPTSGCWNWPPRT